ncbi:serine/threonine-protein kinase [Paucibacter sp. APW11]|uniref:Serine/threonine-protein kinase n=1 Tax=Roseateles aquae TaxID=3077235 RepID=A0ABU3PHK1_9BURK|nr:serine/threonine-protein kinase [Paucibacter sp. APW11]MDT9002055.1 serine/threonine-protein kinase [Paucibacter sp. APW11]
MSAAEPLPDEAPRIQGGDRLGAWRVQRRIGMGAMGEVWLARRDDGLYESEAAIKLLRADVSGPGLGARFARERALLGRLHHPGIARLLDAGHAEGQAYLVLEFIAGQTLSAHVARRHLPVAERVQLLIGIGQAVEYAHGQLIVHRDLKPGNVIVSEAGQPKLLDFGIAAMLEDEEAGDSALTRVAGRRLTPAYAAPEQILGAPLGVAADVYALGVMLYELLSGELPFRPEHDTRQALEHAVLHTEPRRFAELIAAGQARAGGPGLPPDARLALGDLEAICAKALRKTPAERYASVRALIDDLQCWLDHRPVSARREEWRYRARLWLRRNRVAALAASGVLLALSAGLAVSLWQRQRAEHEAEIAAQATDYLGELLASADPNTHGGKPPTVLDLLERSRAELDQRFASQPELQLRLYSVLTDTYRSLHRFDIALGLGERALALARSLWGERDPRSIEAAMDLAKAYTAQNNPTRVVALAEPLQERVRQLYGPSSDQYSEMIHVLLPAYARLGRFAEAEALVQPGRAIDEALFGKQDFRSLYFSNYVHGLRVAQGRWREAEALLEQIRPGWQTPQAEAEYATYVLTLRRNLLVVQMRRLKDADLEGQARALMAEMDAKLGAANEMRPALQTELARYLGERGEYRRAWAEHEAMDAAAPAQQYETRRLPRQIALLLARALAGQPLQLAPQALAAQLQASTLLVGPNRVEQWLRLAQLGLLLQDGGLADQALAALQAEPSLAGNPPQRSRYEQLLGERARQRGELGQALTLLHRRAAYFDGLGEPQYLPHWLAQLDLAATLLRAGKPEAAAALARADALRPASLPPGHPLDQLRQALGRQDFTASLDGRL